MNGVQHKVFSLMCASAYCIFTGDIVNATSFITAPIGAATPDIDHPAKKENKLIRAGAKGLNAAINTAVMFVGAALGAAFILPMIFPTQMKQFAGITGSVQSIGIKYFIWIVSIIGFIILKEWTVRSKVFKWAASHRGITHTLIPIGIVLLGRQMLFSSNGIFTNLIDGYLVGLSSHLFIDSFNKDKCPLLFPITTKGVGFPISIPTKNVKACWMCVIIVGALLNILAYWFKYIK